MYYFEELIFEVVVKSSKTAKFIILEIFLPYSDMDWAILKKVNCDYYCDIALKYFTITNKAKHHCTCVPLETAIALV